MHLLRKMVIGSFSVHLLLSASEARADSYDNVWMESYYISQCSFTAANPTVKSISTAAPGYGALNDWRIGNGNADAVDPGTSAIGAIGSWLAISASWPRGAATPTWTTG